MSSSADLSMLRHTVATVAYRAAKTLRQAPEGFGDFRIKENSRSPVEILAHIGDLFDWALSIGEGKEAWREAVPRSWDQEIVRFFSSVEKFDLFLSKSPTIACSPDRLFQGPVADALTHIGQLAMLRRLYGSAVKGENYFKAEIVAGRVGPEQTAPRREFD
ncbi:MAG TPA: hypothetical protein DCZ69_06135 [Syntrophobacteraceae bacterium]|nr:hypothetical protein [Syntrophobacteraceae bacterium]